MKWFYTAILVLFSSLPNIGCVSTTSLAADDEPLFRLVKTRDGVTYTTEWSSDGSRAVLVQSGFVPPGDKPGDTDGTVDPKPEPQPHTGESREAGDCTKYVYEATGRNIPSMPGSFRTRHYASGKPSEISWESEKNVDKTWVNYELTSYFKMGPGDDNVDFKMYGPNHDDGNKAWYVYGISNEGKAACGAEDKHPGPNPHWDCTGGEKTSFGKLNDKKIGLKTVIWTDSNKDVTVESYLDEGNGKWVKMASQKNPEGRKFTPKSPQNLLLRADGFKKLEVYCVSAQEIKAPTNAVSFGKADYTK